MIQVNADELRDYVRAQNDGKLTLYTLDQRKEFTVSSGGPGLVFTVSTGKERHEEGAKYVEAFCDQFNKTHSIAPGDYRWQTQNASYMVALIASYLGAVANGTARQPKVA